MVSKTSPNSRRRSFGLALTALSLGVIAAGTLTYAGVERPAPLSWCFLCAEIYATDVLLNIVLFIPLGIGLRLTGASRRRVLAIAALITLAVELAQWFYVSGRIASVADLVANVLGAAAGMLLAERGHRLIVPEASFARLVACASIMGWLVVQALTVWAFAPSLRPGVFYGQIAARLGHMDQFTGTVIAAKTGDARVPEGHIEDTEALHRLFEAGSPSPRFPWG